MKAKRVTMLVCAILVMLLVFTGCASDNAGASAGAQNSTAVSSQPAELKVTGLPNGDIIIPLSDVELLKVYEGKAEGTDSEGNPVVYDIKGAYFSDLLEKNGYSQPELAGIRIIATDGYSIEVSADILKTRDIIFAYEMDGQPLDVKNAPLRVFIPGERAMYWVRMVGEINVLASVDPGDVTGIYFARTLYGEDKLQDYDYIGQTYKVINCSDFIDAYPGAGGDTVLLYAVDGLAKNETLENFNKGVIDMSSEDSPQFFASALPSGMYVKNLLVFKYGGNAFWFGQDEITLDKLFESCQMGDKDTYKLTFADGSEINVAKAELASYTLGSENGKMFIKDGSGAQTWDPSYIN